MNLEQNSEIQQIPNSVNFNKWLMVEAMFLEFGKEIRNMTKELFEVQKEIKSESRNTKNHLKSINDRLTKLQKVETKTQHKSQLKSHKNYNSLEKCLSEILDKNKSTTITTNYINKVIFKFS